MNKRRVLVIRGVLTLVSVVLLGGGAALFAIALVSGGVSAPVVVCSGVVCGVAAALTVVAGRGALVRRESVVVNYLESRNPVALTLTAGLVVAGIPLLLMWLPNVKAWLGFITFAGLAGAGLAGAISLPLRAAELDDPELLPESAVRHAAEGGYGAAETGGKGKMPVFLWMLTALLVVGAVVFTVVVEYNLVILCLFGFGALVFACGALLWPS